MKKKEKKLSLYSKKYIYIETKIDKKNPFKYYSNERDFVIST